MRKKSVYFAGSVRNGNHEARYDWRVELLNTPSIFNAGDYDYVPMLNVGKVLYSGPFLIDDHVWYNEEMAKELIRQITRADVVFAWFDKMECYGSMFELGFAYSRRKPIYAYYSPKLNAIRDDCWADKGYDDNHWIMHAFTRHCGNANSV